MNDRRYWQLIDRKKQAFERHYEQEFYNALMESINPIMDGFQFYVVPTDVIREADKINSTFIRPIYYDLYRRVGLDFAKVAVQQLKGYESELQTKLEPLETLLDNPDSFTWIWAQQVNEFVDLNVGDRIVTVTETSKKRVIEIIRGIVSESIDEGLGIKETMDKLEQDIPIQWRKERWRANTIARTEVISAANEGSRRGALATGLSLRKKWLTRLDGRERASHRAANGQEREINQPYSIDGSPLMYPGDIGAEAKEVINCRCVERYYRITN